MMTATITMMTGKKTNEVLSCRHAHFCIIVSEQGPMAVSIGICGSVNPPHV